jgi:hypothetical protein
MGSAVLWIHEGGTVSTDPERVVSGAMSCNIYINIRIQFRAYYTDGNGGTAPFIDFIVHYLFHVGYTRQAHADA